MFIITSINFPHTFTFFNFVPIDSNHNKFNLCCNDDVLRNYLHPVDEATLLTFLFKVFPTNYSINNLKDSIAGCLLIRSLMILLRIIIFT